MTEERDELAQWAADFHAGDQPPIAPDAILEHVARDARFERIGVIAELGGIAGGIAFFLWFALRSGSFLLTVFSAVVVATHGALFVYFVHERTSAARGAARTVRDHVALTVGKRRADLRKLRAATFALALMVTAFWAWLPFWIHANSEKFARAPWRIGIAALAALVTFGLAFWALARITRRTRAELARWQATFSALDGDADRAP